MNKDVTQRNSGKFSKLFDSNVPTKATTFYHNKNASQWETSKNRIIPKKCEKNVVYINRKCIKVHNITQKTETNNRCSNFKLHRSSSIHGVILTFLLCSLYVTICEGRLFDNPHGNQRGGILGGHGHPHPHFSGGGILGRGHHQDEHKQDDANYMAEERQKMLKEYGVDGVVSVQDIGPDGKRRKKVRLGPIVFDPEAIRFDDLDDYNEYNDGPRSKIGRYDYDANDDGYDRDRLLPSRNGGGLNIINKLIVSLANFGTFLYKSFGNLYRYMVKHAKTLNDQMAKEGNQQSPDSGRSPSSPHDINKEDDHGETSLVVIVVASWLIFGIIVALVTYVVNYWSELAVGQDIPRTLQDVDASEEIDNTASVTKEAHGNGLSGM